MRRAWQAAATTAGCALAAGVAGGQFSCQNKVVDVDVALKTKRSKEWIRTINDQSKEDLAQQAAESLGLDLKFARERLSNMRIYAGSSNPELAEEVGVAAV